MSLPGLVLQLCLVLLISSFVQAHEPGDSVAVREISVTAEAPVAASSQRFIPDRDILLQPQGRPADLARLVPGLITVEHSGGAGKADQYFLRGFNADHGTDIAFFTDGMPVNLRSHAHGQGYADLNFIIPETIKGIEVYKGPYHVQFGDFMTAGAVNYVTRDVVEEGVVQLAGGQFNTQRHLLMMSPTTGRVRSLVAGEGYFTDGWFDNPNRYNRFNGLVKLTLNPTLRSELSLTGTHHQGRWNGSGQIPLRAVKDGTLPRFGSIDPTEGGRTQRSIGRLKYHYDAAWGGRAFAEAYLQYYRLDLYSNFTFFLRDPVNGDEIEQDDRRYVYGGDIGYQQSGRLLDMDSSATLGVQTRFDKARVRLGTNRQRLPLTTTQQVDLFEASYSPYLKLEFQPTPWMRLVGGARGDFFTFNVGDTCGEGPGCRDRPSGRVADVIVSTKGNLILGPWFGTELFLNAGTGFHSNDARAVVSNPNLPTLPRAVGYEAGVRTRQWNRLEFIAALWALDLQSELVFEGDTGTTAIKGASRRYGTELSARIKLLEWLTLTGDVTLSHAAFRGTNQAVPLAPQVTGRSDLTARHSSGLSASLQMLSFGKRALTEDRTVSAQEFTVFDFVSRYRLPVKAQRGRLEAFFSVQNLTDIEWRQAQFFFESRLRNEPEGVFDTHFVPGRPRMFMGGVSWYF